MAKKETKSESKVVLERTYVIPLRSTTLKVPFYRKSKRAMSVIRTFIEKHMKSKDVKLGRYLNMHVWEHGIKNPPGKVKVVCSKDDKGVVTVELEGAPKDAKVEAKSDSKKPAKKTDSNVLEAEVKEVKEEKAAEAKKIEKEEIKELAQESKEKHAPQKHAPKMPKLPKDNTVHPVAPKHE
jgi:large subunit ribosomal protein L31e